MKLLRALQPALIGRQGLARLPRPLSIRAVPRAAALCARQDYSTFQDVEKPPDGTHIARPRVQTGSQPGEAITITYGGKPGGSPRSFRMGSMWLRDNCRCTECVNQDTMQRDLDTFAIPEDIHPTKVSSEELGVSVLWSDGHKSHYDWDFLGAHTIYRDRLHKDEDDGSRRVLWGAEVAKNPPTVDYSSVMASEDGVAALTSYIKRVGFVFVQNTPYDDPEKTRELLERIAFIRITHYGGFYDFIPDLAMADTAYTNLALPAHTDTTYFTEPAGLQAFHMLSHQPAPGASAGETDLGGQSLLVDGFMAAKVLREEDPVSFRNLAHGSVPWHASGNKGITIAPDKLYPVIERAQGSDGVHRIRWNNSDRGVHPLGMQCSSAKWYTAARKWNEILKRKEMEYWFQLKPGTVLIFDNWRVLHGRSAFTGIRRICGGYINRDDFISRWRNTNYPRKQILREVMGL
ncbi:Trimethyllysine dioxygenase [Chaetomium strumarium]|uniref:Trimethyllysine dioxygenase n=1 Tax=Chaetomium strumarium TaxID=1170767 RepID=A0AAJ0GXZ2_9PEZI|nr:Trimethyllysine dioxygenase [Chaetomium strumarium]